MRHFNELRARALRTVSVVMEPVPAERAHREVERRRWGVQNIAIMHRLSDLASVADVGSETLELAQGLLSDSQTRVVYQQASNELRAMRDLLQLTDTEVSAVGCLAPGTGLWKVGQRSFVVQHLISETERWVVDTEPRERHQSAGSAI